MLKSITIIRQNVGTPAQVTFPMTPDPSVSSYYISNVDGLDPVAATFTTSSNIGQEGATIQTASRGDRNPVITLKYKPNWSNNETIEGLRRALYSLVPVKTAVTLMIVDDTLPTLYVDGKVESLTPDTFTQDPSIQISILCPSAFLKSKPDTSFGFHVNVTTANQYAGDAPSGFALSMTATAAINTVSITNAADPGILFDFSSAPMDPGQTLEVSTIPGNKYASMTDSSGNLFSVLDYLSPDSTLDMQLGPFTPNINVATDGSSSDMVQLSYTNYYLGI